MKNMIIRLTQKNNDINMTTGNIFCHLLYYSVPLLIGNVFQQLYNTVDVWVLGNYVGDEAFSAVGTLTPIINMFIGTFTGLASGVTVVISQYYGAGDHKGVHDALHTSIVMTITLTVLFTAVGFILSPILLQLMSIPGNVFADAETYLKIYFAGIAGLLFYNIGSSVLRAIGDSLRPFYYLVICAILNIVLDLVFVIGFGMAVKGVAYATIIAQGISAILVMTSLLRSHSCVRLVLQDLKIHVDIFKSIIRIGIPSAAQMAVSSFSNMFVQGYINLFGSDCMGGWTAYHKVHQLVFLPIQSISLAVTTFVGQNLGVKQVDRAKSGVRIAMLMSFGVAVALVVVVMAFAADIVLIFNDNKNVVAFGTLFIRTISPFLLLNCVNQIYLSALRGAGNIRIPTIIMLSSLVLFRQLYLFIVSNYITNTVIWIALVYPAGWFIYSILMTIYYHQADLESSTVIQRKKD